MASGKLCSVRHWPVSHRDKDMPGTQPEASAVCRCSLCFLARFPIQTWHSWLVWRDGATSRVAQLCTVATVALPGGAVRPRNTRNPPPQSAPASHCGCPVGAREQS